MVKEYRYRGYTVDELKKMSIEEFARLVKSRSRRALRRGLTDQQKKLLENIRKNPQKFHKTHCRDMVILPEMIGVRLGVHIGGGKAGDVGAKWASVMITPDMVGHRLGEFAIPIKKVQHSAPGIGASRGSKHFATK